MKRYWAAWAMAFVAFACGTGGGGWSGDSSDAASRTASSGGGGGGASGAMADGAASGSGSVSAGGSTGSSGSGPVYVDASSASLYDAPPPADAAVGETVTLTADSFTVAPGAEVYKCQTFANPFGTDVDLIYLDGTMSQGSHHFFLFNLDPSTGKTQPSPLKDCPGGGLEFHPFPYLSQQPHWIVNYPRPDMGYPLAAQNALMINVHFLNPGSTPVQASVTIKITAAKPGVVTTHIGTIFLNNTFFSVPPTPASTPKPYSKTWTPPIGALPPTYNIFTSWSHMHRTAVDFQASTGGAVFYEEKNWDSPQLHLHSQPMQMSSNSPITWSCSYYNETASSLSFGESAINNVMCIYLGQYYPVVDPKKPDLIEVLN